jgi:hypothetical protein
LDELRLWDYPLNEGEIRTDMCKRIEGVESELVGYWNFDEGEGLEISELVSSASGDIIGAGEWLTSGAPIGDESFFEYFPAGTKKKLFINDSDSFWISTESDNWVRYHVYQVNEALVMYEMGIVTRLGKRFLIRVIHLLIFHLLK